MLVGNSTKAIQIRGIVWGELGRALFRMRVHIVGAAGYRDSPCMEPLYFTPCDAVLSKSTVLASTLRDRIKEITARTSFDWAGFFFLDFNFIGKVCKFDFMLIQILQSIVYHFPLLVEVPSPLWCLMAPRYDSEVLLQQQEFWQSEACLLPIARLILAQIMHG